MTTAFGTLTDDAKKGLDVQNLNCDKFFVIDGHLVPFGAFVPDEITVNLRDIKSKKLGFSTSGTFNASAHSDDQNFDVRLEQGRIADGMAVLTVVPRADTEQLIDKLPPLYQFAATVKADESKVHHQQQDFGQCRQPAGTQP